MRKFLWKLAYALGALCSALATLFLVASAIGTQDALMRANIGRWHLTGMLLLNALVPALGAVPMLFFVHKFRGRSK